MTSAVVLNMQGIAKRFGTVQALRNVSLSARNGEVTAEGIAIVFVASHEGDFLDRRPHVDAARWRLGRGAPGR
jgi:ABC-type histidine transport system ATPase subunit